MSVFLMCGEWGIGLFRNVEIALIALFMMGVAVIFAVIYALHEIVHIKEWGVIALGILIGSIGLGKILSKIAIEPLKEHVYHLDCFSKETLHELNLPINTITANVAMLRKTHDDEKSQKRLERIELAAKMLKERYNELDYLIKKQMEREIIENFDLCELIEERLSFLSGLYPSTQWQRECEPLEVELDKIGLAKVIDNLVDNGVKYSCGIPKITIILTKNTLRICDTGSGMDEVTLIRIFDRYYQSDKTMAGYGIGLGLVKKYCDRYRIGLSVQSQLGEGTCITLEFNKGKNGK
ncbi:MAG: HAMP domain-containing sensor histidine kinase [Sulfuricurvum sp.]|nr:HAMP domain-containing sensor histidine kinase [Sulfuricurvum sp.]MDD5385676.1 HAMP domain-containing sensor histidine kinase [Sulfuricurvum sp.]